jgi:hypothetical protein
VKIGGESVHFRRDFGTKNVVSSVIMARSEFGGRQALTPVA